MDPRDGGRAHQRQVRPKIERQLLGVSWRNPASLVETPLHRAIERGEALVRPWLKKEYPKIKALAQKEKAEISSGDAAPLRSGHPAGCTWGKKGETPIVQAAGAGACHKPDSGGQFAWPHAVHDQGKSWHQRHCLHRDFEAPRCRREAQDLSHCRSRSRASREDDASVRCNPGRKMTALFSASPFRRIAIPMSWRGNI